MSRDMNVNSYPIPKSLSPMTLFGGAIAASVTEANATVIDMGGYSGGSLEVTINSGTGTFSIAQVESEIPTGVFKKAYMQKQADGAQLAIPAIVTTTTESAVYQLTNIGARYLKLVPTLTGTCNATFKFTPNNIKG